VTAEIIHDDDVAGLEGRDEDLLDIGEETRAIDRPIEHAGGGNPVVTQAGEEGHRPPVPVRNLAEQSCAARAATVGARHVGLGPGLVDEDEAGRIEPSLIAAPARTATRNVGPILLAGVQAFF